MPALALLLFLLSVVFLMGGIISMTQATLGVGSVAVACYLAIVARLAQAAGHHDVLKELRGTLQSATAPRPSQPSSPPLVKEWGAVGPNEIRCQKCGLVSVRGPATCACGTAY